MAIITKVSVQKRPGRYNIFIDGKYSFSVGQETLAEFVLLKGKELTDQQIDEIKQYDADAKASDLTAHYLSYEPRTIYEILQYLQKHHISNESAESAVENLSNLGYLDDRQYVKLFLKNNFRVGSDGPQSISRKLQRKGVSPDIISEELEFVDEENWLQVAKRVIKSMKHQIGKISVNELKRKMKTKLLSHGFNSDLANLVIEELNLNFDENEQLEALKKQGIKAYKKFKRYDEQKRNFKLKQYLYSHGFSSSEIDQFLNGEVIPLDELEEY